MINGQVIAVQGSSNNVAGDAQLGIYRMLCSRHDQNVKELRHP